MPGVEPNREQRELKADEAKRERQAEVDELLWLMSDQRGRRFIWRRLGEAGIYSNSYTPGGDLGTTAFLEGRRSVGLKLLHQITEHAPERFNEMQKEAKRNERRSNSK